MIKNYRFRPLTSMVDLCVEFVRSWHRCNKSERNEAMFMHTCVRHSHNYLIEVGMNYDLEIKTFSVILQRSLEDKVRNKLAQRRARSNISTVATEHKFENIRVLGRSIAIVLAINQLDAGIMVVTVASKNCCARRIHLN